MPKYACRGIRAALGLAAGLLLSVWGSASQAQTGPESIADFMVMDVCVDAHDQIVPGMTPVDSGCLHRRKIRAGEPVPYHMHNFPPAGAPCKLRLGTLSKESVPVERNGTTRFTIYYDKGVDHSCPGVKPSEPEFGRLDPTESGSVLWFDKDYSFWLGSWSMVSAATFKSPLCTPGVTSSRQFYRGRILAPTKVPTQFGVAGFGVFESKLVPGSPGATVTQCPRDYNAHITTWVRDHYTFKSGMKLDTIVTSHYTKADGSGTALGDAMQMERSYWTKEFGFTRWEKWARDDWVHPRSGKSVKDLAAVLFAKGDCSKPYQMPADVSPGMQFDKVSEDGSYSQVVRDPRTGEQHRWYISICEDYTNIVTDPPGSSPFEWNKHIDDVYWAP
jgi:hypothetical protein